MDALPTKKAIIAKNSYLADLDFEWRLTDDISSDGIKGFEFKFVDAEHSCWIVRILRKGIRYGFHVYQNPFNKQFLRRGVNLIGHAWKSGIEDSTFTPSRIQHENAAKAISQFLTKEPSVDRYITKNIESQHLQKGFIFTYYLNAKDKWRT